MEGSTFSKGECTSCDQGKFRGFYTVLASQPIAGFRGIVSDDTLWLEVATLHTTQYPKQCSAVYVLCSDLPELIGYDLLKLEDGYIDPDVDESTKAFVDQRISSGAEKVMLWNSVALTNVFTVVRLPD